MSHIHIYIYIYIYILIIYTGCFMSVARPCTLIYAISARMQNLRVWLCIYAFWHPPSECCCLCVDIHTHIHTVNQTQSSRSHSAQDFVLVGWFCFCILTLRLIWNRLSNNSARLSAALITSPQHITGKFSWLIWGILHHKQCIGQHTIKQPCLLPNGRFGALSMSPNKGFWEPWLVRGWTQET